ncbi:hypothetical protein [Pantoea sp. CTOTU46764]|jgi:hypothetical protein|uniref:hypothetical protein n=1 Tax=Pantoea sp. CTOTU46764 TaxID=2953854 RepID=UPI0028A01D72|nr:hypothetical protein [Pantoea sp. CTOTU46764]
MQALFIERFIRGPQALNETTLFVATLAAFHVGIPEDVASAQCWQAQNRCCRLMNGMINNAAVAKIIVLIDQ